MSSNGTQPTASAGAETGLQELPMELHLRINKLLVVPRGSIDVDTVPRPGSRTTTASKATTMRLVDLWTTSPDALSLIQTSKQLYREAAGLLYAETVFKIANDDDMDNINVYEMPRGLTNLKTITVAVDSHVLDVVAAQDDDLGSRFATQLSQPNGHWSSQESADMACRHMDVLRRFAWGLPGQAEDKAGKREKLRILKITSWMGPAARLVAGWGWNQGRV